MNKQVDYIPPLGFEDLRLYDIPEKEFKAFRHIQEFLASWEQRRLKGYLVPLELRNLSAQYQQYLYQYPRKEEALLDGDKI